MPCFVSHECVLLGVRPIKTHLIFFRASWNFHEQHLHASIYGDLMFYGIFFFAFRSSQVFANVAGLAQEQKDNLQRLVHLEVFKNLAMKFQVCFAPADYFIHAYVLFKVQFLGVNVSGSLLCRLNPFVSN